MPLTSAKLAQIDEIIIRRLAEQGVPGASVTIVAGQEPIWVKSFGYANVETKTPVTGDTVFQIASLTKQFTATLVMMLALEGKFSLDDAITNWFPEGGHKWSMISVRHLMAHLSGISDEPMDALDDQRDYSEEEMVMSIASAPLLWQPGTKWDYCNSGFVLLGALVRRITGQFWGDVMQERIFELLGMASARIVDEVASENRAIGYEITDGKMHVQDWIAPCHNTTADGGLMMNMRDFGLWSAAHGSDILLPQPDIRSMWEPARHRDGQLAGSPDFRVGLGWMLPVVEGLPNLAQHLGAWQGFSAYVGRVIDQKLTAAVFTNLEWGPSDPVVIGHDILRMLRNTR